VDGVSVDIARGEFFTMLGPSGSGKTTTLRLIAGFELPDSGRVELGGQDVTNRPPYARDVNTVFQDYALFPHMTVQANVEYGLRIRKVDKAERRQRAGEALEMVSLAGYGARKPAQLSGGQRQRVALARAIVNRPRLLLLDEPRANLDPAASDLIEPLIGRASGCTRVLTSHDPRAALAEADMVLALKDGRPAFVGEPAGFGAGAVTELYA
jgi:putative spermidine/putrescine transport system ATP-binding protein